jgi:hypothetical protein
VSNSALTRHFTAAEFLEWEQGQRDKHEYRRG